MPITSFTLSSVMVPQPYDIFNFSDTEEAGNEKKLTVNQ
jgi:hypothetical protein